MNGFVIPELVLESLIRDGFQNVKADPTIINDIFSQLTRAYNTQKYGQTEVDKINTLIHKDIPVIYSYHEIDAKSPCISIMVGSDTEHKPRAHIGDLYEEVTTEIVDPIELAALHRVDNLQVLSYEPTTGKVIVANSTDLSVIYKGMIYVDSIGTEHFILGNINNTVGDKSFFVDKNSDVDFHDTSGFIKSSLDYEVYEVRGVTGDEQLVIGVHSKDALTTKYLYILVKYFILSRKADMIKRGLYLSSYSGSDFNRDSQYIGDQVFTRFCTITGKIDDTWRSDQVVLVDNIVVNPIPVD